MRRWDIPNLQSVLPPISRPRTRGDCVNGPRPCPWASCRHNLLVVSVSEPNRTHPHGRVEEPGPTRPEDAATCALDMAERGGMTLAEVGELLGVTRERVRQIEAKALRKVRHRSDGLRFAAGEESER